MRLFFYHQRRGFTLIETLVAVALFSVVFTIGVGVFISAMRSQRQAQALISANGNASLVIEQMAREIRTGIKFHSLTESGAVCDSSITPCPQLQFENVRGEDVHYAWDSTGKQLLRSGPTISGGPPVTAPITAENVAVRYLGFQTLGDSCPATLDHAPRVTVVLGVSPKGEQGVNDIVTEIETTVASRQGLICDNPSVNAGP